MRNEFVVFRFGGYDIVCTFNAQYARSLFIWHTLLSQNYVTSRYSNLLAKYDSYSIKETIHEVSEGEYNNNSNAILQLYWCESG